MTSDAWALGIPRSEPTPGDHMRSTCSGGERDEGFIGGAVRGGDDVTRVAGWVRRGPNRVNGSLGDDLELHRVSRRHHHAVRSLDDLAGFGGGIVVLPLRSQPAPDERGARGR